MGPYGEAPACHAVGYGLASGFSPNGEGTTQGTMTACRRLPEALLWTPIRREVAVHRDWGVVLPSPTGPARGVRKTSTRSPAGRPRVHGGPWTLAADECIRDVSVRVQAYQTARGRRESPHASPALTALQGSCCGARQWSGFHTQLQQTSSTPVCMLSSTATSRRTLKQRYTETHRAGTSGAAEQLNGNC